MKNRLSLAILICVALFASGPAVASETFCVKFEGLNGSASHPACEPDHTWGYEYHHLVARDLQGGLPGPIKHNQVIFTREWDSITPQLWQLLDTTAVIPLVTFQFQFGAGPAEFTIRLTNAHILAIEPLIPSAREPNPYGNQSRIRMSYQSISIQFQNEDEVILNADGQPQ